jgi:serine/threonine protein kinase
MGNTCQAENLKSSDEAKDMHEGPKQAFSPASGYSQLQFSNVSHLSKRCASVALPNQLILNVPLPDDPTVLITSEELMKRFRKALRNDLNTSGIDPNKFACLETTYGNYLWDHQLSKPKCKITLFELEKVILRPVHANWTGLTGSPDDQLYARIGTLGNGGFSKVYLVRRRDNGLMCALKVVSKRLASHWKGELVKREFELWKNCNHPFVVKLDCCFTTETTFNFVMEFVPGGTLLQLLRRKKKLDSRTSLIYFLELLLLLDDLHKQNIVYRDVKAENILLDLNGHLKLTDFGLARTVADSSRDDNLSYCGSPIYIAPETLLRRNYSKKVDYYALGVLLFEMLTGAPPFYSPKTADIKKLKVEREVEIPQEFEPAIKEILSKCLAMNPEQRCADATIFYRLAKEAFGIDSEKLKSRPETYTLDFEVPNDLGLHLASYDSAAEPGSSLAAPKEAQLVKEMNIHLDPEFKFRRSFYDQVSNQT